MSKVEGKLTLQMQRFNFVKSLALEVNDGAFGTMEPQVVVTKLELLETHWEKFETSHEKIVETYSEALTDHSYLKDELFNQGLKYFSEAKSALRTLKASYEATIQSQSPGPSRLTTSSPPRRTLPKISLPTFSGEYSSWRPYHDLFSSMVKENPDISNVERLHHLKTTLSGEAALLIANTPITDDAFLSAWTQLVSRYDNKRLLIASHVERLLNLPSVATKSAKDLNSLLNSTTEALNALKALELIGGIIFWYHSWSGDWITALEKLGRFSWVLLLSTPRMSNSAIFSREEHVPLRVWHSVQHHRQLPKNQLHRLPLNPGDSHRVRLLVDPGSERTFISEQLVKQLNLPRQHSSLQIIGIAGIHSGQTRGVVTVRLYSTHSDQSINITAFILTKLTTTLPSFSVETLGWSHLQGLLLADPEYLTPGPIDIILGADSYGQFIEPELIKGSVDSLIAQRTLFGWIVLGPINSPPPSRSYAQHVSVDHDLHDLLTKFWVQEELQNSTDNPLSPEEAECEAHFKATHSKDATGRYVVRLPLKSSVSQLGDSFTSAQRYLRRTLQRLSLDEKYSELYFSFLREYEDLEHMLKVPATTLEPHSTYYLPHHGVLREDSSTTKLRVVFNGSSLTSSGSSLNDILHTGAKLQLDISDVLLWVRRHRYIFTIDITKMFRQVKLHREDWDLQRILWVDDQRNINSYQLTTVTYGTRPAPYLAVRVLLQLVQDEGSKFPLAVSPMVKGRYVDDICGGADDLQTLITTAHQLIELCMAGGFPLTKWQSNHPELLRAISPGDNSSDTHTFEEAQGKVLGLSWQPSSDNFTFNTKSVSGSKVTKRAILSEVAQLFDPLGFLAPVVIRAKMLLQELWLEKLSWDDLLSPQLTHRWTQLRGELTELSKISIPRWLQLTPSSTIEIHGFPDASQLAMAVAVYLKVTSPGKAPINNLVCAKTKVAPLKRLTIPRLELTAAVLLSRLTSYVQKTLELSDAPTYLWTDSSVTLTWINSHPSRWKDFVRNRVSAVQETVPHAHWRFIPGKENPADCATRGLTPVQLSHHHLWWNGPPWLSTSPNYWPSTEPQDDSTADLEERPGLLMATTSTLPHLWDLIYRYSSLTRLLRITALCQRGCNRFRKVPQSSVTTELTPGDLESARTFWVRTIQSEYFKAELKCISSGSHMPKSHPMSRLTAFIDRLGVLRVGGRLKHSPLDPECKHPAILPRDSPFSHLLIADAHQRTLHGGTQLTLTYLRKTYWILGGRAPVRSHILRCVRCARFRGVRAQQLMGQLPAARTSPSRPFLTTGVDYAGPVTIKTWRGRGAKCQKGWLAIFVCFSTSAVHLEAVTDYSTEGFIAAYRRFSGRRGICQTLCSDCGTNFIGADVTLRRLFTSGSTELTQLAQVLANDGTHWSFNPPAAPHFGGKWEAAVKSVKFHLRRTIGETVLTLEELTTLLVQIEAVLNSRPLCALTDDPEDLTALISGHFLIGEALTTIPEPSLSTVPISRLNRWQLIQQKFQHFWSRWSTECLQQHLTISKWHHPSTRLKVGSMVLLTDERFPPSKWPLARVMALHPGSDGLTRVVTIKTATTTLKRPITKLAVLPVPGDSSTSSSSD